MVFNLSPDSNTERTFLRGNIVTSYPELEALFGKPINSDGYKVSGEWIFEGDSDVFTIYDWKQTELYQNGLPSVIAFRESEEKTTFNVGGKETAIYFINWLEYKLAKLRLGN